MKKSNRLNALIFLLIIFSFQVSAQKREKVSVSAIEKWMKDPQVDMVQSIPIRMYTSEEVNTLLTLATQCSKDSVFEVRWRALSLTSSIGGLNSSDAIQRGVLSRMMAYMFDADSRIRYSALQNLGALKYPSFTSTQKDSLVLLINQSVMPNELVPLYKIAGEHYVQQAAPLMESIAFEPGGPFFQRWVAQASLARMGSVRAEEEMHKYLVRIGISLDAVNSLYPYVLFSRSRSNVDYLLDRIRYDESLCESANPNVTVRIPCAYLVLKVVGPEIRELKWHGAGGLEELPMKEALQKARELLKETGSDWNFKD